MKNWIRAAGASLLLAIALPSAKAADETVFGDWMVGATTDKTYVYAATMNESESLFGEYCNLQTGSCRWILGLSSACDVKDKEAHYPALGNTSSGATTLNLQCDGKSDNNSYRYVFTNWSDLEKFIETSSKVGFALPLGEDSFKALHFSLNGMKKATALAEKITSKVSKVSTHDSIL